MDRAPTPLRSGPVALIIHQIAPSIRLLYHSSDSAYSNRFRGLRMAEGTRVLAERDLIGAERKSFELTKRKVAPRILAQLNERGCPQSLLERWETVLQRRAGFDVVNQERAFTDSDLEAEAWRFADERGWMSVEVLR
jgi:hypothetical protein